MTYTSRDAFDRPISSMHQVWDLLMSRLRAVREQLRSISDKLYGKQERLTYLGTIHASLKLALDHNKAVSVVANFHDLEQLLQATSVTGSSSNTPRSPRQLQAALDVNSSFLSRARVAISKMSDVKTVFTDELLPYLELYCSNYTKLGITDDKFYLTLRARGQAARKHLANFERLSASATQGSSVQARCFCDCHLSQEVSIEFNCDTFPLIRVIPDLLQKLEMCCDTAADWLRSDKVYSEQLDKETEHSRALLRSAEQQLQLCRLEYDELFAQVKIRQTEADQMDDGYDALGRQLARLEAKKTRLDIDVAVIERSLLGCRDQLRDLNSAQMAKEEAAGVRTRLGQAHSSYKSRLCHDAQAHSNKLDALRKKSKKLAREMSRRRTKLKEIEAAETDVQKLSKKLRVVGRQKARLTEEIDGVNSHLEAMLAVRTRRMRPELALKEEHEQKKQPDGTKSGKKRRKKKPGRVAIRAEEEDKNKKKGNPNSAELNKAFRIIKNQIGLGWKDLARTLPYAPAKRMSELNNEIRVIEYEYQGQLKEQAYQSLYNWYSHNGRRASVDDLTDTLRTLNENRLADNLETEVSDVFLDPSD